MFLNIVMLFTGWVIGALSVFAGIKFLFPDLYQELYDRCCDEEE